MPWPSIPSGRENDVVEYNKILYKGQVEEELARRQDAATAASKEAERDAERQKAAWDAEYALRKTVHDTRLEVAKAAIERGRAGAEFVRNAAAAIVTLYTGILGVAFATSAGAERLPARGVAPAVFLGLAVALSTAYVAFLTRAPSIQAPAPHSSLSVSQERRLNAFSDWASRITLSGAYFLHSAVVSLGWGVLLLPAPFLRVNNGLVWIVAAIGLVATALVAEFSREKLIRDLGQVPSPGWLLSIVNALRSRF
jgi:hypothetical protein